MNLNSRCALQLLFSAAVLGVPAFSANSVTIVSVGTSTPGSPALGTGQFLMESWTSTVAFTDVSISAYVYSGDAGHTAATAYLTTQVGPGATSATLVAQNPVTLPVGMVGTTPELQLFGGLTLPPGTYYLVMATADSTFNEGWLNGSLPTPAVTATGVTFNGPGHGTGGTTPNAGYPPASSFPSDYSAGYAVDVTGVPLASAAPTGLIIPQVVDGSGWQTTFGVTNTTGITANAALQFFRTTDAAGDTEPWALPLVEALSYSDLQIGPGATVYLHTPNTATTLTQGFGELVADPGVVAYAIFTLYVPGRQNQDGTALAAAPGTEILVPFDNTQNFATTIAVVNTSETSETLSAKFTLASGDTVSATLPSIPAQGHAAFPLSTQFPETAGQQGTLQLSSLEAASTKQGQNHPKVAVSQRFSVIGLRFNPTGAFTSLPVYVITSGLF